MDEDLGQTEGIDDRIDDRMAQSFTDGGNPFASLDVDDNPWNNSFSAGVSPGERKASIHSKMNQKRLRKKALQGDEEEKCLLF